MSNLAEWSELFSGPSGTGTSSWHREQRTADVGHEWVTVSNVGLDPDDASRLVYTEGDGDVIVNGPAGNTADLCTPVVHGDCELHVEFLVSEGSNSGVYVQGQYEVQIRDDRTDEEVTYRASGGIYARRDSEGEPFDGKAPLLRASKDPGEWQSFDIVFRAPRFDESGAKVADAVFESIRYNGELVHQDVVCVAPTGGAIDPDDVALGPVRLQGDHGPVAFRNLRIRGDVWPAATAERSPAIEGA
ncbi:DUF1080 domain-containing protein [Isoptericola sp. BMS4]|uniref:3-keto-disaccharide hydrolase n=1 Tax=Isoptericola sp. BMS4 TaxID=2527875 RepID=UPI00141F10D6|nr:DUF1080 domain-containing protein [Isoptericola sp. BMS4]